MIIGIDLGTTNSCAAIWRDGRAEMIPNRLGHNLTPSAISVEPDGRLLVGLPARDRQVTHPAESAIAFKRYMGTRKATRIGGMDFQPEELSALVLKSLKEDAEAWLGEPVTEAVITVPAYFNDRQRKATRRAGELAGLTVARLINEPTAAALAYGIDRLADESRFLVFDLGGGTFDVSILEIFEGVIEVRASTGDNWLGGEDFNELLVRMMRDRFDREWGAATSEAIAGRLRDQAERARRRLSEGNEAEMLITLENREYRFPVTADQFEQAAQPLLARLREPVIRALRDSDIRPDQLAEIVLIGGATRMPPVRRAVARMMGRFPNNQVNPDEAVAIGAAVQAALKARDAALREVVLTDVCPYSLGVGISRPRPDGSFEEGVFSPIIERNTIVPASRVESYETLRPNQPSVVLKLYQGESRRVEENVELGEIEVPMPRGPAGQMLECRFSYDINGLLEVDVHVPETGERRQLVVLGDEEADPQLVEERRAVLAALKVHPRETEAVRAALARANRAWENALGDQRAAIGQMIEQFTMVADRQDPHEVEHALAALRHALDQIEGQIFL